MKTVIIGSNNPVKAAVVESVFPTVFPDETFQFKTYSAASGVADQPMGWKETKQGAQNRADDCARQHPEGDYFVGLEGGIEDIEDEYWVSAWMCVRDSDGKYGFGRTGAFILPPDVTTLIKNGLELGHATDQVFNAQNTGYKKGVIGFLTNDAIDRTKYYENALTYSLIPFVQKELYQLNND